MSVHDLCMARTNVYQEQIARDFLSVDITNNPRKLLDEILIVSATAESQSKWSYLQDTALSTMDDATEG